MAFNAGTVRGELELVTRDFQRGIDQARRAIDKLDRNTKQSSKSTADWTKRLATARDLLIVMPPVIRAVIAPLKGLFSQLKDSSSAAADFEQVTQNLTTSLALQGNANAGAITDRLKEYAGALQETTAFSDGLTLQVAQTLTVLGVQEDQLEDATKAVLDYSAATGREANQSAINFGKTLGGVVGELGEAFPAVKELTEAQLKNGEAFKLAADQLGGFSEQAAKTTKGLRAQLVNAFGDLQKEIGFAINPVLDAITAGATEAIKSLRSLVEANSGDITNAFASLAQKVVEVLRGLADRAIDLPALLLRARIFFKDVEAALSLSATNMELRFMQFGVTVREELAQIAEAFSVLPLVGDSITEAAANLKEQAAAGRAEIEASQAAAAELEAELLKGRDDLVAQKEEAEKVAAAFRETGEATTSWQQGVAAVQNSLGVVDEKLAGINDKTRNQVTLTTSAARSVGKALETWRRVNAAAEETAQAAGGVGGAVDSATRSTEQLADAAGRARSEFEGVAAAASEGFSGGSLVGSSGGDAFGRRRGGSAGFDLSTVEGARAALAAAQNASAASVGGLFSNQARTSAFLVGQQVQQRLSALIKEQTDEFTRGVLSELNRNGVFDPQARQDILSSRLEEARRLGTLPQPTSSISQVGRVF